MGVEQVDSSFAYRYVGSEKPENPLVGDVVVESGTGQTLIYDSSTSWVSVETCIGPMEAHPIKIERCTGCGAPLPLKDIDRNGLCECSFCSKIQYVW